MKDLKDLLRENLNKLSVESKCENIISKIIDNTNISNFKIGKTRQNLDERFNSGYSDEYDEIKTIFKSDDTDLIDWLERALIKFYKKADKCDNIQDGGGPDGATQIYIVLKYKK